MRGFGERKFILLCVKPVRIEAGHGTVRELIPLLERSAAACFANIVAFSLNIFTRPVCRICLTHGTCTSFVLVASHRRFVKRLQRLACSSLTRFRQLETAIPLFFRTRERLERLTELLARRLVLQQISRAHTECCKQPFFASHRHNLLYPLIAMYTRLTPQSIS